MAQVDLNQLINKLNVKINQFIQKAQIYFKSLTQYEKYAWIAMGVGFVMILVSVITW